MTDSYVASAPKEEMAFAAESVTRTAVENTSNFDPNIAIWFFFGGIFAIIIFLVINHFKK